ncbi:MAG: hypothetical protein P1U67_14260 [Alcanivoracaceae bacterium]|nr:hypothetical protein [Alcanivoracaceae bacterium]
MSMVWDEYRVRQWLQRERTMLRELSLMLVAALVIGIYFLEHVHSTLEHNRREAAEALAQQLSTSSAEFVVTGNLVSLNVIAGHAASLPTVSRIEFRSVAGIVLSSAGEPRGDGLPVSRAVRVDEDGVAGTVELWPANTSVEQEKYLESNFVLVVFCLLALRVLAEVVWRRLQSERNSDDDIEADMVPVLSMTQANEIPKARLRISIVNFDRMRDRLTTSLIEEMVAPYRKILEGIAGVYGAQVNAELGKQCALEFKAESRADVAFQALCAGMLFRRVAREVSEQRKKQGRSALEFKLLVSCEADTNASWSMCVAGLPGRVHVPEAELLKLELDARLLYQAERCIEISNGETTIRLQPVEQLAQRYQKLIAAQAAALLES